ncbi:hypothetical protein Tco_1446748 [Tanacetum coccineum]
MRYRVSKKESWNGGKWLYCQFRSSLSRSQVTNTVANHAKKPEKFNGQNFKRWQQKMFFYLGTLNLACAVVEAWKTFQTSCVHNMSEWFGGLFVQRVLQNHDCPELWESLERKHKTEDAAEKWEIEYWANSPTANIKGKGRCDHNLGKE